MAAPAATFELVRWEVTYSSSCPGSRRVVTVPGRELRLEPARNACNQPGGVASVEAIEHNLPATLAGEVKAGSPVSIVVWASPVDLVAKARFAVTPPSVNGRLGTVDNVKLGISRAMHGMRGLDCPPVSSQPARVSQPQSFNSSLGRCRDADGDLWNDSASGLTATAIDVTASVEGGQRYDGSFIYASVSARAVYAMRGGGVAAPPAGGAFEITGLACQGDQRETGAAGRIACGGTTRGGPAMSWEWQVDGRPVVGNRTPMQADGFAAGTHRVTAVAIDAAGKRTPPYNMEIQVTGVAPAGQVQQSAWGLTVKTAAGTQTAALAQPVAVNVAPKQQPTVLETRCWQLLTIVYLASMEYSEDVPAAFQSRIPPEVVGVATRLIVTLNCIKELGLPLASREAQPSGNLAMELSSGAVVVGPVTGRLPVQIATPSGSVEASNGAKFAVAHATGTTWVQALTGGVSGTASGAAWKSLTPGTVWQSTPRGFEAVTGQGGCGEPMSCSFCLGGGIRQKWLAMGGQGGRLGCPVGPEAAAVRSRQGTSGQFAQFGGGDGGYIVWHSSGARAGQAYAVEGCIFRMYHSAGGTTSSLGFPLSDEYAISGGKRQDFEGGAVFWDERTRQCGVMGAGGATTTTPTGCSGFAGTWDMSGTVLRLAVNGSSAEGRYTHSSWRGDAFLTGTVAGRTLTGTWHNPGLRGATANRGPVRFELAPDGQSYTGYWREENGTGGADWNARCVGGPPQTLTPPPGCGEPMSCSFCLGGGIRQKWLAMGGQGGRLGCPVGPEAAAVRSRQGTSGQFAQFGGGDGGYIVWHSSGARAGQAYAVEGCIFRLYHSAGGTTSSLGFPLSDAYSVAGGVRQDFEGGAVFWDERTRQCGVMGAGGATTTTTTGCSGFAGTWDMSGTVLRLAVNGSSAEGRYTHSSWRGDAFLTGTVAGRTLTGTWHNPGLRGATANRGPVRFELAPDGQSYTGYWREENGTGGADWNARCVGPPPASPGFWSR